jgi:hypothetical protein
MVAIRKNEHYKKKGEKLNTTVRVQVCNSARVGTARVAHDLNPEYRRPRQVGKYQVQATTQNPQEMVTTTARLPRSLRSLAMTTLFRHCEGAARSKLSVRVCIAKNRNLKKGYPPSPPPEAVRVEKEN